MNINISVSSTAVENGRKAAIKIAEIINKARQVIKQVPQDKYRQILTLRYLAGWSFRSISDELKYNDPKSVYKAHGWALTEAQKVLNKKGA